MYYVIKLDNATTLYFFTFKEFVAYKKANKIYPYGFTEKQNGQAD